MPSTVNVTVNLDASPLFGRNVTLDGVTQATDGLGQTIFFSNAAGPGYSIVCATPGGETGSWSFNNASSGDSGSGSGFSAGPQNIGSKGANTTTFNLTTSSPPPPPNPSTAAWGLNV